MKPVRIGKFFGIEVELHYSWFIIFALLTWALSSEGGFFQSNYPQLSILGRWVLSVIAAFLLFASVLAHELSHSLVANHFKMGAERITLFFFGGVAQINGENITPKKEFFMAVIGPLFSLSLGLVFLLIFKTATSIYIQAITRYLYILNFIVAGFNLLPGFPLDGGRMFRAVLWYFMKDIKKATKYAVYGGKLVAGFLIAIGFIGMFFGGGGLWFALIGFFLYYIAGKSYEQVIIKETLGNVKIKDVMRKNFNTVKETASLSSVFSGFIKHSRAGFLVVKGKKFTGVIITENLKTVPKIKWDKVKVKDVMMHASRIKKLKKTDTAYHALTEMSKQGWSSLPVIEKDKIIGVVDAYSLLRLSKLKTELE